MTDKEKSTVQQVYAQLYLSLCKYACSLTGVTKDAEDLVQAAFLEACRKPDQFMSSDSHGGWLRAAIRNHFGNYIKAVKVQKKYFGERTELTDDAACCCASEFLGRIDLMRPKNIKEDDFEIYVLANVYSYTADELAGIFGISPSACYKRVQRTGIRLRKIFEKD